MHFLFRSGKLVLAALALLAPAAAQEILTDAQGRQVFPHGFVTLTGDNKGHQLHYTLEDYQRMVPLGANFQVIRIFIGQIGGWPGRAADPKYFDQLDYMVGLGKKVGLQTVLKLTVYDVQPFERAQWQELWMDKDGRQKLLVESWTRVFQHFRNEPAIFGYDLLNEPIRGNIETNAVFVRDYLVPLYRKLMDALREVSPEKWAVYQPPYHPPYLRRKGDILSFGEMDVPIERPKIAYAPHGYGMHPVEAVQRFRREAALSKAAMFFGEHGNATTAIADEDLEQQEAYQKNLIRTVTEFDRNALGAIKAWYCGTQFQLGPQKATWALYQDDSDAGVTERKYVMDVLARPKPLVIAGRVETHGFNFATRIFEMTFTPDKAKGESEIFIPLERHYPDGFRVLYKGLVLACSPLEPAHLRVLANPDRLDASSFRWDDTRKRLVVRRWDGPSRAATLRVVPGGSGRQ